MVSEWEFDRTRLSWWAVALVLGGALLFVVYSFVGTFVFGIFIYYATRPVYKRIKRRTSHSDVAVTISLFALALPVLLLLSYVIAIALQEFDKVARIAQVAALQKQLAPYINVSSLATDPQQLLTQAQLLLTGDNVGTYRGFFDQGLKYAGFFGNALLHLFLMLVLAFYLLRDDHKLSRWFRNRFGDDDGVLEAFLDAVDRDYHNIFFGNILNAVLTGTIGAIMYNVLDFVAPPALGIPSPSLLGLLTGVASLIPIVGMKLVYFPVAAYLFGDALLLEPRLVWFPSLFVLVSLVVVDTIPDLVLRPYVSGRNLHIGLIMLAYTFGPLLFGWYGIFLGPMILVLAVHFAKIVLPELLAGQPIRPWEIEESELRAASATADPADGAGAAALAASDDASETADDASEAADDAPMAEPDPAGAPAVDEDSSTT